MANVLVDNQYLQDIADAIRTKKQDDTKLKPGQMDEAILSIETGIDTSDGNIDSSDLYIGKIGYSKDQKITGSWNPDKDIGAQPLKTLEIKADQSKIRQYYADGVQQGGMQALSNLKCWQIQFLEKTLDKAGVPTTHSIEFLSWTPAILEMDRVNIYSGTHRYLMDPAHTQLFMQFDTALGLGFTQDFINQYNITLNDLQQMSGWYEDIAGVLTPIQTNPTFNNIVITYIYEQTLQTIISGQSGIGTPYVNIDKTNLNCTYTKFNNFSEEQVLIDYIFRDYTNEATAEPNDIISPKTAYINGRKLTGTIIPNYGGDTVTLVTKQHTLADNTYSDIFCATPDFKYFILFKSNILYLVDENNNILAQKNLTEYDLTSGENFRLIKCSNLMDDNNNYNIGVMTTKSNYCYTYIFKVNTTTKTFSTSFTRLSSTVSFDKFGLGFAELNSDIFVSWVDRGDRTLYIRRINSDCSVTTVSQLYYNMYFWISSVQFCNNDKILVCNIDHIQDGASSITVTLDSNYIIKKNLNQSHTRNNYGTSEGIVWSGGNRPYVCNFSIDSSYNITRTDNVTQNNIINMQGQYGPNIKDSIIDPTGTFVVLYYNNQLICYEKINNEFTQIYNDTVGYANLMNDHIEYKLTSSNVLFQYKFNIDKELLSFNKDGKNFYKTTDSNTKNSDILYGKIAYNNSGKVKGTMPNNGTLTYTPTTTQQTIPAGYTSGGTIAPVTSSIDSNIIADNIKSGVTILGVTGTYKKDALVFTTVAQMEAYSNPVEDLYAIVYETTYVGTYRYDGSSWTQIGDSTQEQETMDVLNDVMGTADKYEGNGGTDEQINEVLDDILGN